MSAASFVGKDPTRIRVLTGGGDVPGLKAAGRALVQCAFEVGYGVAGIQGSSIVAGSLGEVAGRIKKTDLELNRLTQAFC